MRRHQRERTPRWNGRQRVHYVCMPEVEIPGSVSPLAPLHSFELYRSFCHASCGGPLRTVSAAVTKHTAQDGLLPREPWSCIGGSIGSAIEGARRLGIKCRAYRGVDFGTERADMARATARAGNRAQYLATASRHRFCLVAQGDPGNTAKIVETVALGGAGGCIPVFVLYKADGTRAGPRASRVGAREQSPSQPMGQSALAEWVFARDYPFVRWLDYCHIAYFISKRAALANMSRVLDWLERVTPAEAEAKLAALREVRPAFVFARNSSVASPSAAEFVLAEACEQAKALGRPRGDRIVPNGWPAPAEFSTRVAVAGGRHERCTLHW